MNFIITRAPAATAEKSAVTAVWRPFVAGTVECFKSQVSNGQHRLEHCQSDGLLPATGNLPEGGREHVARQRQGQPAASLPHSEGSPADHPCIARERGGPRHRAGLLELHVRRAAGRRLRIRVLWLRAFDWHTVGG